MQLRDYQVDLIDRTRVALRKNKRVIVQAPTGCHESGHPILMADGSFKKVEDVQVGDLLMSPGGGVKTVLRLHRGKDNMYLIKPVKGDGFVVNEGHILNLYLTPEKKGQTPRFVNVSVSEYMQWSNYKKHLSKLHRRAVDFEEQETKICPWAIGFLIGDGGLGGLTPTVTTSYQYAHDYLSQEVASFGASLNISPDSSKAPTYRISTPRGKVNLFTDELKNLGLMGCLSADKFIPKKYLRNSRENRLLLLAGLLDSDGSLDNNGFDWISKSEQLAEDIVFLCRSLGLAAYTSRQYKSCQTGAGGYYYRVNISGDCSIIPNKNPNKKAQQRRQIKNVLVTGFEVVGCVGRDDYYGFELDGDHLYLDGSFIVHHNSGKTLISCFMMQQARKRGLTSWFVVHQRELLNQTSKSLWANKLDHGLIISGKTRTPHPVQLASVMTLKNRIGRVKAPDLIIVDESHRALANSYTKIIEAYPNAHVIGLTATPERTDGRGLGALFQEIIPGPSITYLIDQGYLCDYEIYGVPVNINTTGVKIRGGDFDAKQLEIAANTKTITGDAVSHYKKFAAGVPTVVMCVSIKHADDVAQAYRDAGIRAIALHSASKNRDQVLDDFEAGKYDVITSVSLLIEGADVPKIGCVQWLRPTMSRIVYMQGNGRGLRPHPNKNKLLILDHVGNFMRFGMPDEIVEWSLNDNRKKRKARDTDDISVQVCANCYFTFRSGVRVCPHCNHEVEYKPRKIEVIEGELERIERAAIDARQRKIEQGMARGLTDLINIGIRRKMKNPAGWAVNLICSREKRKPTAIDWTQAKKIQRELQRGAA